MSRHTNDADRSSPTRNQSSHSTAPGEENVPNQIRTVRSSSSPERMSDTQIQLPTVGTTPASSKPSQAVIQMHGNQDETVLQAPERAAAEVAEAEAAEATGAGVVEKAETIGEAPGSGSPPGMDSGRSSSQDITCRICQESEPPLFVWCDCKGTIATAHKHCLEEWIARSGATRCELCGYVYHTRRVPRYSNRLQSVRPWLTGNVMEQTALVADAVGALLCLAVGAGTAIVCGMGARSIQKHAPTPRPSKTHDPGVDVAVATVTAASSEYDVVNPDSVFLQLVCVVATMISLVWFALAARFHVRVWLRWWNRQYDVRVVPRSADSLHKAALRKEQQRGKSGTPEGPRSPRAAPPARPVSAQRTVSSDNSRYPTVRGNRYYTILDPFDDWTTTGLPYSMLTMPLGYQTSRDGVLWSSQVPQGGTGIHSYRLQPGATALQPTVPPDYSSNLRVVPRTPTPPPPEPLELDPLDFVAEDFPTASTGTPLPTRRLNESHGN